MHVAPPEMNGDLVPGADAANNFPAEEVLREWLFTLLDGALEDLEIENRMRACEALQPVSGSPGRQLGP